MALLIIGNSHYAVLTSPILDTIAKYSIKSYYNTEKRKRAIQMKEEYKI